MEDPGKINIKGLAFSLLPENTSPFGFQPSFSLAKV
jgi:hypothetical protein